MLKNIRRFDLGQINSIETTTQGFLKIPGFATRTGVFTYRGADGSIRAELRHPDDVFAPESLETLKNVPVTLEHPPEMVTPENFRKYSKGYTTDRVDINRDLVETDVIVADADAIESIEKKERRELSCGYLADLVEESGSFNGAPYNFRQKNIRYNHLAVVKSGRGGPEIRLRMDSKDAVMMETMDAKEQPDEGDEQIVFMGKEFKVPSSVADGLKAMIDRYDEMRAKTMITEAEDMKDRKDVDINQKGVAPKVPEMQMAPDGSNASKKVSESDTSGPMKAKGLDDDKKLQEDGEEDLKQKDGEEEEKKKDADGVAVNPMELMKHELAEMKAKNDAMQAKLDEYASSSMGKPQAPAMGMGEGKMDSKDFQKKIRARARLERTAEKLLPYSVVEKFDSMSDEDIMSAVIKHRHPTAELKDKSSVYLQTRFDSIAEMVTESVNVRRDMGNSYLSRMDAKESSPLDARTKMIQSGRELWNQPLSANKK